MGKQKNGFLESDVGIKRKNFVFIVFFKYGSYHNPFIYTNGYKPTGRA